MAEAALRVAGLVGVELAEPFQGSQVDHAHRLVDLPTDLADQRFWRADVPPAPDGQAPAGDYGPPETDRQSLMVGQLRWANPIAFGQRTGGAPTSWPGRSGEAARRQARGPAPAGCGSSSCVTDGA